MAGYDNLTRSQDAYLTKLMSSKPGTWPEELRDWVTERHPRNGDELCDLVGQWVKQHSS